MAEIIIHGNRGDFESGRNEATKLVDDSSLVTGIHPEEFCNFAMNADFRMDAPIGGLVSLWRGIMKLLSQKKNNGN